MKDKKSKPLNLEKPASPPENQSTATDQNEDEQAPAASAIEENRLLTSEPEIKSSCKNKSF